MTLKINSTKKSVRNSNRNEEHPMIISGVSIESASYMENNN